MMVNPVDDDIKKEVIDREVIKTWIKAKRLWIKISEKGKCNEKDNQYCNTFGIAGDGYAQHCGNG